MYLEKSAYLRKNKNYVQGKTEISKTLCHPTEKQKDDWRVAQQ
jgi:hypothetical protein